MVRLLFLAFVIASPVHPVDAQPQVVPLTDQARASVLTMLPGDALHALFGHTAIRIADPGNGVDLVYNYGTFDFADPLFIPKFVYGQMDYFLSVPRFERTIDYYSNVEGRPVLEQVLNLTSAEVASMFSFLEYNARPENRFYRYDFFFDNCSTRPRDVIEEILGERLIYGDDGVADERTFRQLLDPYLVHRPALRSGMYFLLGSPADRPATQREAMFLPIEVFNTYESSSVMRETAEPLVLRTDTVAWVSGYEHPTRRAPWLLILTTGLFIAGLWWSVREIRRNEGPSDLLDALVFGLIGMIGLVVFFMSYVSQHTVTAPNLNLAWAWPTHLVAAALLRRPAARFYFALAAAVTGVFCVFWFMWPQVLPLAFLPIALLAGVRSAVRWYVSRPTHALVN